MAQTSLVDLLNRIIQDFADNSNGDITAEDLRQFLTDLTNSGVFRGTESLSEGSLPMLSADGQTLTTSSAVETADRVEFSKPAMVPGSDGVQIGGVDFLSAGVGIAARIPGDQVFLPVAVPYANATGTQPPFYFDGGNIETVSLQPVDNLNIVNRTLQFMVTSNTDGIAVAYMFRPTGSSPVSNVNLTIRANSFDSNDIIFDWVRDTRAGTGFTMPSGPSDGSTEYTLTLPLPAGLFFLNGQELYITIQAPEGQQLSVRGANISGEQIPWIMTRANIGSRINILSRNDVGTDANDLVQLDSQGRLPAIDASQLTGLPTGASPTASQVSVNSDSLNGLIAGASNVQAALARLDATGIGAPIFEFTGNYSAEDGNRSEWFNGFSNIHVQGSEGQSNSRRTFSLPGTTALNSVFNDLASEGLPEVFTLLISYFGGSSNAIISNSLSIVPKTGGPNITGRNSVTLSRGDSLTVQISRSGSTISDYEIISRGLITTTSGQTLNDIEFQPRGWNAAGSSFLPSDVLKGYAFRVFNAPTDGSGRLGVRMQNGDWVVWFADNFTTWADTQNWFVIPNGDIRRITAKDQNFLEEVSEFDNKVDIEFVSPGAGADAVVWLTPAEFTTPPFITPSADSNNPRTPETISYIGGRENKNSQGQFQFGSNRFGTFMYIGITPSTLSGLSRERVDIVLKDVDGSEQRRFNLNSDFDEQPSLSSGSDYTIFSLNTTSSPNTLSTVNYASLETIEIVSTEIRRNFSFDPVAVNVLSNIPSDSIDEEKLSPEVVAKLNAQHGLFPEDQAKLLGLQTSSTQSALPQDFEILAKYGEASNNPQDYFTIPISQGIIPDFVNRVVTLLVDKRVSSISVTRTTGQRMVGEFLGRYAYSFTLLASVGDNPLNEIGIISGTIDTKTLSGANSSFKINENNLTPELLNEIQHPPINIPSTLEAFNTGSRVFKITHTEFRSNNNHVSVPNTWAVLKNEPDGSDGTPTYPISSGDFVNEVSNTQITLTPPSDLSTIYIPRLVEGQLDNGVETITNQHMSGPGIVKAGFELNIPSDNNWRQLLGFWLYAESDSPVNKRLVEIKDSSDVYRPVLSIRNGKLAYHRNNQDGSPATTRTVTHRVWGLNGEWSHTFTGTAAQEEFWRVYEARTYTIHTQLIANGNDEGTANVNFTVDNLNTAKSQNVTLNFANGHSQNATIEYVPNDSVYGGPGHTIRFEILQLADNPNFDIDHLIVYMTYDTVENVPATDDTYSIIEIDSANLNSDNLHRIIVQFRKSVSDDRLEVACNIDGQESFIINNFNYDIFRFKWNGFKLNGNDLTVMQNIQGMAFNTGTPLNQLPTLDKIQDWALSHDNKSDDYVWDNLDAPDEDTEAVYFPEAVNIPNIILED